MIVDAFLAGILPQNGQSQNPNASANGFSAVMDKATESTTASSARTQEHVDNVSQKQNQPQKQNNKLNAQNSRSSEREPRTEGRQRNAPDSTGTAAQSQSTEKPAAPTQAAEQTPEQLEQEMKQKLAEVLDITVDELDAILVALGIPLAEFVNPERLNELMQAVYKAESPVALLNVSDITQVFTETKAVLEQFVETLTLVAETEIPADIHIPEEAKVKTVAPESMTEPATDIPQTTEGAELPAIPVTQEKVTVQQDEPVEAVRTDAAVVIQPKTVEPLAADNEQIAEPVQEQADAIAAPADAASQQPQSGAENMGQQQSNQNAAAETTTPDGAVTGTTVRDAVQYTQSVARAATAARPATPQEVIGQLLERMNADVRAGITELRITLQPESLGDVTLRITTQGGLVTAHFVAENERVKEIIESNLERLKESLAEQGVEVSALEVEVGLSRREQQLEEFLREQQRSSNRIRDIIDKIAEEEDEQDAPDLTDSTVNYTA